MGLFDFFKRKKAPRVESLKDLSPEEKWNRLSDLWANRRLSSPYYELMSYYKNVTDSGYYQYFYRLSRDGGVNDVMELLVSILPENAVCSLNDAYAAYRKYNAVDDDELRRILEECDYIFLQSADEIKDMLLKHADELTV